MVPSLEAFQIHPLLPTLLVVPLASCVGGVPASLVIRLGPGHSDASAFYLATGRFHLFTTCNTWVARALRSASRSSRPRP